MEFKYRNGFATLAKSELSLVFPDVIEDLHTSCFLCLCGCVCKCFVFHLAEVIPQCFFIMCQPGLKLRQIPTPSVQQKHKA